MQITAANIKVKDRLHRHGLKFTSSVDILNLLYLSHTGVRYRVKNEVL